MSYCWILQSLAKSVSPDATQKDSEHRPHQPFLALTPCVQRLASTYLIDLNLERGIPCTTKMTETLYECYLSNFTVYNLDAFSALLLEISLRVMDNKSGCRLRMPFPGVLRHQLHRLEGFKLTVRRCQELLSQYCGVHTYILALAEFSSSSSDIDNRLRRLHPILHLFLVLDYCTSRSLIILTVGFKLKVVTT